MSRGSPSRWRWSDGKPFHRRWRSGVGLVALLAAGCADGSGKDDTGHAEKPDAVALPEDCSALPAQDGAIAVSDAPGLLAALADSGAGDVLALADGTYDLTGGAGLVIPSGVTVRSASGNAGAVVLEGGFATAELATLETGATLAEVTLAHAYGDAVAVHGYSNARVYGVVVDEPGERAVAVLPERGVYADAATIGCVTVTRATECDVSIEGVQTEGSRVYGADVRADGCDAPAVKFATGSKATVIERSRAVVAGPVAFQLGDDDYAEDDPRVYADAPCDDAGMGHFGGVVRNVFASGGGVRAESTCGARVEHVTSNATLSWGFSTDLVVANNLAALLDTGGATLNGNLTPTAADFAEPGGADYHLAATSPARDAAVGSTVPDDIDGDARDDGAPDVGADEYR